MRLHDNDDLIGVLSEETAELRMLALHLLCEGYAGGRQVFDSVLAGWDRWGAADAFTEFPMLSYFAVPADAVEECCQRAAIMVQHRALTAKETRCAGKLIEHVTNLPASDLEPHLPLITSTVAKSKIFFRVDKKGVKNRVALLSCSADQLAEVLNSSIQRLVDDANDAPAVHGGLHALELLRRNYPDYMDLSNVLAQGPADSGAQAVSFQLTLQSLIRSPQPGFESHLATHLLDRREAVLTGVVDALVRSGTLDAANALVSQFCDAESGNQKWIARGLQRIRARGLAKKIADLRANVSDTALRLMLLIAEVRQFDSDSCMQITAELHQLHEHSDMLIDSLRLFDSIGDASVGSSDLQAASQQYMHRANTRLAERLKAKKHRLERKLRKSRTQLGKLITQRYRT